MVKLNTLDILQTKLVTPQEFDFDNAWIPPMEFFLSMEDVNYLNEISTSRKLSAKIDEKYRLIDNILTRRGFKRFSGGTNRVVYNFLEDDRFVVKIATGRVAMQDNLLEFENQAFLKPYVAKMFYTSPCGTVGFAERVMPIKNRDEFRNIADDVFDILVNKFLGRYVVEDVGTQFFMNWGIRKFSGPVLLDYPYIYKLDGRRLYCTKTNEFGEICNGEIDYDAGFNYLICSNCGKRYLATDLRDNSISNKIIIKGGSQMQIKVVKGDKVLVDSIKMDDRIYNDRQKKQNARQRSSMVIRVVTPDRDYSWENGQVVSDNLTAKSDILRFAQNMREAQTTVINSVQSTIEQITEDLEEFANMQRFVSQKKAQQNSVEIIPDVEEEEIIEEETISDIVDDTVADATNTDNMTEFSLNVLKAATEEVKEPYITTFDDSDEEEIEENIPEYDYEDDEHPESEEKTFNNFKNEEYIDSEEEIENSKSDDDIDFVFSDEEEYENEQEEYEEEKLKLSSAYGKVISEDEEAELNDYISHQEEIEEDDEYPTSFPGKSFIPDDDNYEEEIHPKNGKYSLQDLQRMKNASNPLNRYGYGRDDDDGDRYNFTHGKGKKRKDKRNKKNKKNNMIGY